MQAFDNAISIKQAARQVPGRQGRGVHVSTIHRWASRGLRGIRLETRKVGGQRMTSLEALERFFAAVNRTGGYAEHDAAKHDEAPTPRRRLRQIAHAHAEAEAALQAQHKQRGKRGAA